jgi:lipopolysaccharide biosynthesis regulator YciM
MNELTGNFTEIGWLVAVPMVSILFFALGWLAAASDQKKRLQEVRALPKSWVKGLNHLLNDQTDDAIEHFIGLARQHPQTIELQVSLATVFRKRGEIIRALRLLQHLSQVPVASERLQHKITLEQALGFYKAGLLDRAETTFLTLKTATTDRDTLQQANVALLDLYQLEKNWDKALTQIKELQALDLLHTQSSQRESSHSVTQYTTLAMHIQCEQLSALPESLQREALYELLAQGVMHPRPLMMLIQHTAPQDHAACLVYLQQLSHDYPAWLGLTVLWVMSDVILMPEVQDLLHRHFEQHPDLTTALVLVALIESRQGAAAATVWLKYALVHTPSLVALVTLLKLQATIAQDDEDIQQLLQVLQQPATYFNRYQCTHCGFKAQRFYWQCPGCRQWDTYQPDQLGQLTR